MSKWLPYVGPGWADIIKDATTRIEERSGIILHVKEKFGELRIYVHGGDYEAISEIVHEAEAKARVTCEECGKPGELGELSNGVYKTLCYDCYQKLEQNK